MFKLLIYWLGWSLGYDGQSPATSSGFDSQQLVPRRGRNGLEAATRILSTLLFFAAIFAQFMDSLAPLIRQDAYWLMLPSALWAYQAIFRPATPMDSAAIGTGLWCFGPYLPFFLLNITLTPLYSLLAQMGVFGTLFTYGLIRDIRKETREADKPEAR